ncbi:hypothetical protein WJX81_006639 [Elliptochloris bilobata]|uniref:Eukaryotic translation initiation factor 3 subunit M n=1 Tax=Elliptochloris bilobata TaxID=381761 RepID=A0AAW1RE03_9CHLO
MASNQSLLVETSEEDSFLAVVRHIADLLNEGQVRTALADTPGSLFVTKCESLLAEQHFAELLTALVQHFDLLFSKDTDRGDVECCINIACHLVPRVAAAGQAAAAVDAVVEALTSKTDSHADLRLAALTQLYNVVVDAPLQLRVLLRTLAYAKASNLAGLLAPVVKNRVESWVKDFDLSVADQRTLYLASADLLRSSRKKAAGAKDAFKLTLKALATFEGEDPAAVAAVKGVAADAVADYLRSADVYSFDLLEAPPIKQLAADEATAPLHQLLQVVIAGDVKAFEVFRKEHAAVLEARGLVAEDVQSKTRIMALLVLGGRRDEVSFSTIQEALCVGEGDVEAWVVRAIGKKLLEARIDQMRRTVAVTKCAQRTFPGAQWRALLAQLGAWKDNLHTVKELVGGQSDTGMSRGVPTSIPLRA